MRKSTSKWSQLGFVISLLSFSELPSNPWVGWKKGLLQVCLADNQVVKQISRKVYIYCSVGWAVNVEWWISFHFSMIFCFFLGIAQSPSKRKDLTSNRCPGLRSCCGFRFQTRNSNDRNRKSNFGGKGAPSQDAIGSVDWPGMNFD